MTRRPPVRHILLVSIVWGLLASCSGGELTFVCVGDNCSAGAADAAGDSDQATRPDGVLPDGVDPDADPSDQDFVPEDGEFGDPCNSDSDCLSQICILGLEGIYICTELCRDSCPVSGYACQLIESSGSDLVRICYPEVYDLCKPCEQDYECGGLADRCLEVEDGLHCASDCSRDGECPDGYDCRTVGDYEQCLPVENFCSDCFDRDSDQYGIGAGCLGEDCNDLDPTVFYGAPELCDFKDNNCNFDIDEDIDVTSDPLNCGGCNLPCLLPNAVNICVESQCYIGECSPGFYDLDPEQPGCEYDCSTQEDLTIADVPDQAFADTNCDGIDGDASTSIFVNGQHGHPAGNGTMNDPVDSIWQGIELAVASDGVKPNVIIAEGTYTGEPGESGNYAPLTIVNEINLYGGYDALTWQRALDNLTIVGGNNIAVRANDIKDETIIANLTIQADSGSSTPDGPGENSIGLLAQGSSGLVIMDCIIRSGDAGNGDDGEAGAVGRSGEDGTRGGDGHVHSSGSCPSTGSPSTGAAGPSPCAPGGGGGSAARSTSTGGTGGASGSVRGGPGGSGGSDNWLNFPDDDGDSGSAGCTATSGASYCTTVPAVNDGSPGSGGTGVGSVGLVGVWVGSNGSIGGDGDNGYGGGGGGGGGGATGSCSGGGLGDLLGSCDGYGGAGGGGGGGGCGAGGGLPGMAGGGSFGLFLVDSTPIVDRTAISSRNGGRGGNGGDGGRGGDEGRGAGGGSSYCNGGSGGRGGDGTAGGDGGDGGGGGGGVSFAVYLVDSSDANFTEVETVWGFGGQGGRSRTNSGSEGESGAVRRVTR